MAQRVRSQSRVGQRVVKDQSRSPSRLIATTGRRCPLGCIYCFASEDDYDPPMTLRSGASYEALTDLDQHTLVQPACDTELLLDETQGLDILHSLVKLRKDVSFATKLIPSGGTLRELGKIAEALRRQGNILSVSVSIPCLASARMIEPHAPPPAARIQTVRRLNCANVHCIVAIRPLLPFVPFEEISEIVDRTWPWCNGYTTGPYYFKRGDKSLLSAAQLLLTSQTSSAGSIDWLSDSQNWEKLESPGMELALGRYIAEHTMCKLYKSNIEAVYSVKTGDGPSFSF